MTTRQKIAAAILICFGLSVIAYPFLFSPKESLNEISGTVEATR
ncbi:MAG: hypothetical protein VX642_03945 [Bdellovibrionota bacterium]|nr:hypothetical protein [Bdellovibrionota bacterium]